MRKGLYEWCAGEPGGLCLNPSRVRFIWNNFEIECGKGMITARWNDEERWGEICTYTPYGNFSRRWNATTGHFDKILCASGEYLTSKLFTKKNGQERTLYERDITPFINEIGQEIQTIIGGHHEQ